jgi:hypothetical protein
MTQIVGRAMSGLWGGLPIATTNDQKRKTRDLERIKGNTGKNINVRFWVHMDGVASD